MSGKRPSRSEVMKSNIIQSAGELFAKHGFEAVTMREIAKKSGCSHTTIYIYFKDKETLLYELAAPSLQELQRQLVVILQDKSHLPKSKFKEICSEFIRFCLSNRNLYPILFMVQSSRVDEEPDLEINRLRIDLFHLLNQAVREALDLPEDDSLSLKYTRMFFYLLHGMIGTYMNSEETTKMLLDRLETTFIEAIDVFLQGIKIKLGEGS